MFQSEHKTPWNSGAIQVNQDSKWDMDLTDGPHLKRTRLSSSDLLSSHHASSPHRVLSSPTSSLRIHSNRPPNLFSPPHGRPFTQTNRVHLNSPPTLRLFRNPSLSDTSQDNPSTGRTGGSSTTFAMPFPVCPSPRMTQSQSHPSLDELTNSPVVLRRDFSHPHVPGFVSDCQTDGEAGERDSHDELGLLGSSGHGELHSSGYWLRKRAHDSGTTIAAFPLVHSCAATPVRNNASQNGYRQRRSRHRRRLLPPRASTREPPRFPMPRMFSQTQMLAAENTANSPPLLPSSSSQNSPPNVSSGEQENGFQERMVLLPATTMPTVSQAPSSLVLLSNKPFSQGFVSNTNQVVREPQSSTATSVWVAHSARSEVSYGHGGNSIAQAHSMRSMPPPPQPPAQPIPTSVAIFNAIHGVAPSGAAAVYRVPLLPSPAPPSSSASRGFLSNGEGRPSMAMSLHANGATILQLGSSTTVTSTTPAVPVQAAVFHSLLPMATGGQRAAAVPGYLLRSQPMTSTVHVLHHPSPTPTHCHSNSAAPGLSMPYDRFVSMAVRCCPLSHISSSRPQPPPPPAPPVVNNTSPPYFLAAAAAASRTTGLTHALHSAAFPQHYFTQQPEAYHQSQQQHQQRVLATMNTLNYFHRQLHHQQQHQRHQQQQQSSQAATATLFATSPPHHPQMQMPPGYRLIPVPSTLAGISPFHTPMPHPPHHHILNFTGVAAAAAAAAAVVATNPGATGATAAAAASAGATAFTFPGPFPTMILSPRKRGLSRHELDDLLTYRYERASRANKVNGEERQTTAQGEASGSNNNEAGNAQQEDELKCMVCLDDVEEEELLKALRCGHEFHHKCIEKWLRSNRTCPICRRDSYTGSAQSANEIRVAAVAPPM